MESELRVGEGLLFKGSRLVIPENLQGIVLTKCHNRSHSGIKRTMEELSTRFYWKGMWADVKRFCLNCQICQRNKRGSRKREPLKPIRIPFRKPRAVSNGYSYITLV